MLDSRLESLLNFLFFLIFLTNLEILFPIVLFGKFLSESLSFGILSPSPAFLRLEMPSVDELFTALFPCEPLRLRVPLVLLSGVVLRGEITLRYVFCVVFFECAKFLLDPFRPMDRIEDEAGRDFGFL